MERKKETQQRQRKDQTKTKHTPTDQFIRFGIHTAFSIIISTDAPPSEFGRQNGPVQKTVLLAPIRAISAGLAIIVNRLGEHKVGAALC